MVNLKINYLIISRQIDTGDFNSYGHPYPPLLQELNTEVSNNATKTTEKPF